MPLPVLSLLLVAGLTLSLNYFDFEVLINLVKLVNLEHTNKLNLKKINETKGAKLHSQFSQFFELAKHFKCILCSFLNTVVNLKTLILCNL